MHDEKAEAIAEYRKNQLGGSRRGFWFKIVIGLLLVVYGVYAAFHVFSSLNQGCRLDTVLKTMTPVKELYLKPKLDSELQQSPEARATGLIWVGDIELLMEILDFALSECLDVEIVAEYLGLAL